MWYLAFLLIIGAYAADHAWETGNEYHYLIESRTLTVLDKLSQQFSGIVIKGGLTIQVKSPDTLQAVVSKTQYAPVHKTLENWNDEIADLKFDELSMSGKSFEIKLKHGVIRDVLIDQDVLTWEVNLIKSIVSQLQVDLQGENVIASSDNQIPDDSQPFGVYKAMEDSVGGKCEVLYSITPVPENFDSIPFPNLRKDGLNFFVTKTKNYNKCEQQMAYHSGITDKMNWKLGSNDGVLSRSSTSSIIISGNVKHFTIQSSLTTSEIFVRSKLHDTYSSAVYDSVKLTLDRMNQISNPMSASNNLVSTGNLVYIYNNPFSNQRKLRQPSVSLNSMEARSSENSNEENRSDDDRSNFLSNSGEEREYLQSKPTLNEAPESPLLPYFIGYKGESIQKSEDITSVAARFIAQIAWNLETSPVNAFNFSPATEYIEPCIILIRLIRTMNVEQIAELENKLSDPIYHLQGNKLPTEYKKSYDKTTWDIFFNAVVSAGTGPALISIKNMIKNGQLKDTQAAMIISKIPKTALTPTSEYVNKFFELITDEQVTKQRFLNTSAPLAFAELVRYTQSNRSIHYPVHSFGHMVSKQDNALLETYIPYMANQLTEAIKDGDSRRIQTYIMALGNFGHPKVLSVFEPYLEGTLPASTFQRLMMVVSLNRLSENFPRLARSVAFKIYMNIMEAYELRCAAVYVVMKTNPPLVMLQRMARFTNQDQDRHVNSVIKTNIDALANLEQPEFQDLAAKARIARELLNPHIDTESYSQGFLFKKIIPSLNMAEITILQIIGSQDTTVPKSSYLNIYHSYGGFNLPPSRMSYEISSLRALLDMWYEMPWMIENETQKKLIIEETIEKLGIKGEDPVQFEGNIFVNTLYGSQFSPFDNNTIEETINAFKCIISSWQRSSKNFTSENINYLHYYDMTVAFPTESGLPFIYTLTVPKLLRINIGGGHKGSKTEHFKELTAAGYIMVHEKVQSRIGFVTPFEHRHYVAGIDTNTRLVTPLGLSISVNTTEENKKFKLTLQPSKYIRYGTGHSTVHFSVVPYTARNNILDLEHDFSKQDNDTLLVHTKEPHEIHFYISNWMFVAKSDLIDSKASEKQGMEAIKETVNLFCNSRGAYYRRFDGLMYFGEVRIRASYDFAKLDSDSSEATIPTIVNKEPDSEERKKQFLKEVGKNMNSAYGYVFDMSIDQGFDVQVFTLAYSYSQIDHKSQALFYWNVQSADDPKIYAELGAIGYVKSKSISLNPEKALEQIPNDEFKAEIRLGNNFNEEMIKLEGNWTRTDDVKDMAMKSEIVKKCRQDMKQGNILLPACQKANKLINQKDLLMMSIDTTSDILYASANRGILWIQSLISENYVETMNLRSSSKNTIDMEIKMLPDNDDAKISLRTSQADVSFSLKDIIGNDSNVSMKDTFKEQLDDESVCVLDKTHAVTFDGKVYPLKLGKCWHVMMTIYPKRDPNNFEKTLSIPSDMRAIVMAQEMDDGSKQIKMILGDQEVHLQKSGDCLEASVDGETANFSDHKSHQEKDFEIYGSNETITVFSPTYEITVEYDGEHILLMISDNYLNAVRGLCGNYDTQPNNDFIIPENCILTKAEEFAATYAMTQESCQGPAPENKRKAEQSTCMSRSYRPSDVISDREAGRSSTKNRGWGYH